MGDLEAAARTALAKATNRREYEAAKRLAAKCCLVVQLSIMDQVLETCRRIRK